MRICFDMDGTIADLYGVENWLDMLRASDPTPYRIAEPLLNLNALARALNRLQAYGYEIGIISWLSKTSTADYDEKVAEAKRGWLKKHLHSVHWDFVEIVPYGTDKNIVNTCSADLLFDDEERNRENWNGEAYNEKDILEILRNLPIMPAA